MEKIKCDICGTIYDELFIECPNCRKIKNKEKKPNIEIEEKLEKKEEIIVKRNNSVKSNSKKNINNNDKLYSYLLLIMGMILLFVITFSSIINFALIPLIHYSLTVILLFVSFNLTYQNNELGYFTSMAASFSIILMIYERDYISCIIGVYLFISSFKYLIKK